MAPEMSFSYFFNHLYSDPVSIGGLLVFILMVSGYFWGMGLQKLIKGLEKMDCTILGVFTIIALFQLQVFWSVKTQADTALAYQFLKVLILAGPVFCIIACILKKSLPVPTWKHLFSFLSGFGVSVFLIHLSSRLTTNNLYYDSVTYLSQVLESVFYNKFGGLYYVKGIINFSVDPLHDLNGYYYFWAMLLKYVHETAKFTYTGNLVAIYIWGATFLYGMSLGSLIVNSVNVLYRKGWQWKGFLFLVMIVAPYYVNYWNNTLAFFGNTIRTVCVGYTILLVYLYFSRKNSAALFVPVMITHLAGICFSSTGLFLSSMVTAAVFFTMCLRKTSSWKDYAYFILSCFPLFYYVILVFLFDRLPFVVMTGAAVLIIAVLGFIAWLIRDHLERFNQIGRVLLPAAIAGLVAVSFLKRNGDFGYSYFFASRSLNDMTVNMTSHLSSAELYRNILFYALLAAGLIFANKKNRWFRWFLMILLVLFINPLVQPAVSTYLTKEVYSRVFDLLINPFTMCFLVFSVDKVLSYAGYVVLPLAGAFSLFLANTAIKADLGNNLLNAESRENYDWEQKADRDTLEMYQYVTDSIANDSRPVILSQEVGLKGYVPDIIVSFTSANYRTALADSNKEVMAHYITTILNPGRRFGDSDEGSGQEAADFTKLSTILSYYQPDYLIISQTMSQWDERGWYNNVYTDAVNKGQAELLWNNNTWAILKVNKAWAAPPKNATRYWVHRIGSEYQAADSSETAADTEG